MTSFNNGLKVNVIKGASAEAITSATISCLSSKSIAIEKANEASVSASSAEASASTASLKANEASNSASYALISKTNAATSEENAFAYKNSASVSAATATNKAIEASDSVDVALAYQYGAESAYNSTLSLVNNLVLPSVTHTVDTVDDFGTIPNGIYTVIVKDLNRGGTFIYDATQSAINNGGTIFDGWVRQYSGAVNVKWFGYLGDGSAIDATSIANAHAVSEKVTMPNGSYLTSSSYSSGTTSVAYQTGIAHTAGTEYTLTTPVVGFDANSYGLFVIDLATTMSGNIKLQLNGSDIFGDMPSGYTFSTDTILLDGIENNRIMNSNRYQFAITGYSSAITSISVTTDTIWAGTINFISLLKLDISPMTLGVTAEDGIYRDTEVGIKGSAYNRGDLTVGDTSSLMAYEYDGILPTPSHNVAVGYACLSANQRGDENTAIGSLVLTHNEGSDNTAVGYSALRLNTKGQENTSVGYKSGRRNTTGFRNTFMGFWAGTNVSTGKENVDIGWRPNTEKGNETYSTYVGSNCGTGILNGISNVCIGFSSGRTISGQAEKAVTSVVSVGAESKPWGNSSVAIGFQSKIGTESLFAPYAIAIGKSAQAVLTNDIALGYNSESSGLNTLAIGLSTLSKGEYAIAIGDNTQSTGPRSLAIGNSAKAVGQQSIAIGALTVASAGDYNTNIGGRAGLGFIGGGNTFLGWFAGNQAVSYNNCTLVGSSTTVTGSNQVQLGAVGSTTYVYGAVQDRSDIRDKTEVENTKLGLDFITKLRPVEFKWDMRESYRDVDTETGEITYAEKDGSKKGKRKHQGFIAQEVQAIIEETGIDFGGFQDHSIRGGDDVMSIGYEEFIAPMVKAIQELTLRVKELEAK